MCGGDDRKLHLEALKCYPAVSNPRTYMRLVSALMTAANPHAQLSSLILERLPSRGSCFNDLRPDEADIEIWGVRRVPEYWWGRLLWRRGHDFRGGGSTPRPWLLFIVLVIRWVCWKNNLVFFPGGKLVEKLGSCAGPHGLPLRTLYSPTSGATTLICLLGRYPALDRSSGRAGN